MGVCQSTDDVIFNDIMLFIRKGYKISKADFKVIKELYRKALKETFNTHNEKTPYQNFIVICKRDIDVHPIHQKMMPTKNEFPNSTGGKNLLDRIKKNINATYIPKN